MAGDERAPAAQPGGLRGGQRESPRGENNHRGPRTALLFSEEELGDAVTKLLAEGQRREDILMVEFCDTSDSPGKYRLYSAFNLGGRIVPAGIDFGRNRLVKPSLNKIDWPPYGTTFSSLDA